METGAPSAVMGFRIVCGGETEVPLTKPWASWPLRYASIWVFQELGTMRRTEVGVGGVESLEVVVVSEVNIVAIGKKKKEKKERSRKWTKKQTNRSYMTLVNIIALIP